MVIDGQMAKAFFARVEECLDEAGRGEYRAFKLVDELAKIGFKIVAMVPPNGLAADVPQCILEVAPTE